MRVLLLHQAVPEGAPPDEADVLVQAEAVERALRELGHDPARAAVDLDLGALAARVAGDPPDLAFNLVESLAGGVRLAPTVGCLLDQLGVPYTGSPAEALFATGNKPLAKRLMSGAGLPTPAWHEPAELAQGAEVAAGRWIVKSAWEHASVGLDEDSVLAASEAGALAAELARRRPSLGGAGFVERYVEGREINLSLLGGAPEPEVLPAAEMLFEGWEPGRPRVVGYRAKWDEGSFEYRHTTRRFGLPETDAPLLEAIERLARQCWRLFGLRGWARVDFRVDEEGAPWILEVNTNPCLSPDAGFAAALERAGHSFTHAVERILADVAASG
jgi:D-alanine-D-alanine ligase